METIEMTIADANKNGLFLLESIKEDEKSIKAADKLPSAMRDVMLRTMDYKSYKYGKEYKGLKITGSVGEVLTSLISVSETELIYAGVIYKASQASKVASLVAVVTTFDVASVAEWIKSALDAMKPPAPTQTFDRTALVNIYEEVLRQENASYIPKTDEWRVTDPETGLYEIKSDSFIKDKIEINIHRYQYTVDNSLKPAYVLSEFKDYKLTVKQNKFFNLQRGIRYVEGDDAFREQYLTVWHKVFKIEQDLDIWVTLMSHFFCQIKCRIYDIPTKWQMMIAIFGEQGIGKSHVCRQIVGEMLGDYYDSSVTLDRLCDERNAKILMDNYCLNIEELTQSGSNDVQSAIRNGSAGKLKTIITEIKGSFRPMRTNDSEKIRINASILSNANFHIYDIVNDESGMRRFFEFSSKQPKNVSVHITDPEDVQFLYDNSMRFIRSINENTMEGYFNPNTEIGAKVTAIQNSYIKVNTFSEFLSVTYVSASLDTPNKEWITKKEIVEEYLAYLKAQGIDSKFAIKNIDSKLRDAYGVDACKKVNNLNRFCIKKIDVLGFGEDGTSSFQITSVRQQNAMDKYFNRGA